MTCNITMVALFSLIKPQFFLYFPRFQVFFNLNYNTILKSDWLSTVLILALIGSVIGQYTSCLSNWRIRAIARALESTQSYSSRREFIISSRARGGGSCFSFSLLFFSFSFSFSFISYYSFVLFLYIV